MTHLKLQPGVIQQGSVCTKRSSHPSPLLGVWLPVLPDWVLWMGPGRGGTALLAPWLPSAPGQAQGSDSAGDQLLSGHMKSFALLFKRPPPSPGSSHLNSLWTATVCSLVFMISQQWWRFCLIYGSVFYSSSVLATWAAETSPRVVRGGQRPLQFSQGSPFQHQCSWSTGIEWSAGISCKVVFHADVDVASQFMNSLS